jgi:2-dehydro-3-deoxyphosphogluconate aldolase/(4S)-4-hydroxy-2-oxoglutarate aldolase
MNQEADIFSRLSQFRVIPVIAINSVDTALPLADALIKGGLPVAEITFRTKVAAEVIALLSKERPEILVGAGTVLSKQAVDDAVGAGARFAMAPGTNPEVIREAQAQNLPFIPGIATPSDIEAALANNCTLLKFFPAEMNGGAAMLKAVAAPYKHLGIRFIPTGGITVENMKSYLDLDFVAAVGGTWLATEKDIAEERWSDITEKCLQVTGM